MPRTPIHLWIMGVLSLLWNAGGALDYVMTKIGDVAYMAQQPVERLSMLEQAPWWFSLTWALGIWLSIAGSVLLLLRSRFAEAAFAVSLFGLFGSSIYTYGIADGGSMLAAAGMAAMLFSWAIPMLLLLQWYYARAMNKRGVLR
jgi:hypothetical protein